MVISLDTAPTETGTVSVDATEPALPISGDVAANRAFKARVGLPAFESSYADLYQSFLSGREHQTREAAAAYADFQKEGYKQEAISKIASGINRPLTNIEAESLHKIISTPPRTDPQSVFEEYYPMEYMENVRRTGEVNPSPWALANPDRVNETFFRGKDYMSKQEVLRTFAENAEQTLKAQGWAGYLIDQAKGLVPGYTQVKERGLLGVSFFGDKLGKNLDEQAKAFFQMPFDKAKALLLADGGKLLKDNPSLALSWAHALLGQSYSDKLINNSVGLLDIPAGGLSNIVAKSIARAVPKGAEVYAQNAVRSAIKSSGREAASHAAIAEAAGDVKQAGIEEITTDMVVKMRGIMAAADRGAVSEVTHNPITSSLKGMPDSFVGQISEIGENKAKLRQGFVAMMTDTWNRFGNELTQAINNTIRVNRIPAVDAVKEFAGRIAEDMVNEYPGLKNRIMNNSLRYDRGINGHWIDYQVGNVAAQPFTTEKVAKSFAKSIGFPNAELREAYGPFVQRTAKQAIPTPPSGVKTPSQIQKETGKPYAEAAKLAEATGWRAGQAAVSDSGTIQANIVSEITKLREAAAKLDKKSDTFARDSNANVAQQLKLTKRLEEVKKLTPTEVAPTALPQPEAVLDQQGGRFYLTISKPLPEGAYVIREGLLDLPGMETPKSWLLSKIGMYITPNETLSEQQTMARMAATYGPANFYKLIAENAKDINALRGWSLPYTSKREKWNQWKTIVEDIKGSRDDITGKQNPLLNDVEFANRYQNKWHRAPDEQEVAAYHAYKREELIIKTFDALGQYKDLHRAGAQEHKLTLGIGEESAGGSRSVKDYSVYGSTEREFPKTNAPVLIADAEGNSKIKATNRIGPMEKMQLRKDIEEGKAKVIRLTNPAEYKFDGLIPGHEGARVSHIITYKSETKNINWQSLVRDRLPDYEYEHYAAQAIVKHDPITGIKTLEGERTIGAFNLRALGKDIVKSLDDVRILLRDGKDAEAMALHAKSNLPFEWKQINTWFKGETITAKPILSRLVSDEYKAFFDGLGVEAHEGFRVPATLSLDEPIRLVPRNRRYIDLEGSRAELTARYGEDKFQDGTRAGYKRRLEGQESDTDFFTVDNKGSRQNPLYDVTPVQHMDPMTSINRSLNKVIQAHFMDDYKTFSIEHWIQEAKHLLDVPANELKTNPYYHFFNPVWVKGAEDFNKIEALKTSNAQIRQFVGMSNSNATFLHSLGQTLADAIYTKGFNNAALVPTWLLPTLRDPFSFVRSAVFDIKLGLFNPAQLMVQMQTFTNIFGIAGPKYAVPGTKAAMLHQWARFNSSPEIMEHLDKLASTKIIPGTSAFRPGEFKEARELLSRTGFEHVGGEHVRLDSPWVDIVNNERQSFLNAGRIFFREGEKSSRVGAWYTAYKEFRDVHPTGAISEADLKTILTRADLLTVNMSRASASTLHQGIWSIPTQFLSYQLRLAELFMGKRLTNVEKFRAFSANSIMYGLPVAYGLSGVPFSDYIRKEAIESGYVVGDNWLNHLVTEGLPSTILSLSTGNHYNFGERYGSTGFEPLKEALRSDAPFLKVIGGAAYSVFHDTIANMDGMWKGVMSMVRQDDKYKLKIDDFLDPFLEIPVVDKAKRLMAAWNTGKWITKKEAYVDDISMGNAIFQTLTGLQSQEAQDLNTMNWSANTEKETQKEGLTKFIREYRRAIQDQTDGNPGQADDRIKRSLVYLEASGYPMERVPNAIALAAKGWESQIDRIHKDYYMGRNVPETRKSSARDAYIKNLEIKKEKGTQ